MLLNLVRLQKTQLYFAMATRANSPVNMKTKGESHTESKHLLDVLTCIYETT